MRRSGRDACLDKDIADLLCERYQVLIDQGGFARVYEVMTVRGERKAVKVIRKATVQTRKNKTKVSSIIPLHVLQDLSL